VTSVVVTPATATIFQGATLQLSAEPRDSTGAPVTGRTVVWSTSDSLRVRVNATSGLARAAGVGTATVTATGDGRTGTSTITVQPVPVAQVSIAPTGATLGVGDTRQFTATPLSASSLVLPGRTVSYAVRNTTVATVGATGLVTAAALGSTYLLATVEARTDSVLITVSAAPVAVAAVLVAPTPISLLPGGNVKVLPRVLDASGAPLSGRTVTFQTSDAAVATVGADSIVRGVGVGAATITVTSGGVSATVPVRVPLASSQFSIDLRNIGPAFSAPVAEAFDAARLYWQAALIGDLPDFALGLRTTGICGVGTPTLTGETIEDLVIVARIDSIDGRGRVLGSAGPCLIRNTPGAPSTIAGIMSFDSADVASLVANGSFRDVIRHEMGHVLGIGTLWTTNGCLSLPSSDTQTLDTHFSCLTANSAFDAIGGAGYTGGNSVPVENCALGVPTSCGAGTRNGHWREFVFRTELMTGYLSSGGVANPSSVMTLASLVDLGYTVNYGASEPYVVPGSLPLARRIGDGPLIELGDDIIRLPIQMLDRTGRVVRIITPIQ